MTFKNALRREDFVLTSHIDLATVTDAKGLLDQGEILRTTVDAIQLTDSSRDRLSSLSAAAILIQNGIDPIVHINCRDRNRIAMQKDFLGATALGVSSVLVIRGAKILKSKKLGVRNVYDMPALEFMAYIQGLKQDENHPLSSDFIIGANAEAFDPEPDWSPNNLIRKCDAGSNFVQLQICFDVDVLRHYMASIVANKLPHRAQFIAALAPLPSADAARELRDNVKGALIPDAIIDRLEHATDSASEGVAICAEALEQLVTIPGLSGANLVPLGAVDAIPAAITASGIRPAA
jgi:methylenetetrahydrofolate reductase (NADPH)